MYIDRQVAENGKFKALTDCSWLAIIQSLYMEDYESDQRKISRYIALAATWAGSQKVDIYHSDRHHRDRDRFGIICAGSLSSITWDMVAAAAVAGIPEGFAKIIKSDDFPEPRSWFSYLGSSGIKSFSGRTLPSSWSRSGKKAWKTPDKEARP